jgi:hypothetical protein
VGVVVAVAGAGAALVVVVVVVVVVLAAAAAAVPLIKAMRYGTNRLLGHDIQDHKIHRHY